MLSLRSLLAISMLTTFVVALVAGSATAAPATYNGISADGTVAIFSTKEQMVPGDTDQELDVYERTFDPTLGEYVTRQVSLGPGGGNDTLQALYDGISEDGEEVFFSTKEGMVLGDKDHHEDVYVRNLISNQTFLVSAGAGADQGSESCAPAACGTGPFDAGFVPGGVVPSGDKVFFVTDEKLVAADKDDEVDVYMRDLEAGTTVRVSAGDPSCAGSGCGNGTKAVQFLGADQSGDKAYLVSNESLNSADTDSNPDIYVRDLGAGTTSLVSAEGECPSGLNCNPTFGAASADGSHVFFESNEQIDDADEDSSQDVYDWDGSGKPTLVSIGPDGGSGSANATFAGSSADGSQVYFQTSEALVAAADKDHVFDVYERAGGITTLVSAGEPGYGNEEVPALFSWASADGSTVVFKTGEQLTASDSDEGIDVYARSTGTTSLVSTGAEASGGDLDAAFAGASADGAKIFFVTPESLVAQDGDESSDIYLRSAAGTQLVSAANGIPGGGNGEYSAGLHGVAADGSRAFFVTQERLTVDDDFLEEDDVYSWSSAAGTLLVSVENDATLVLGPPPPALEATNPVSPGTATQPRIIGQSVAGALIKIYATSNCSKEPVAQGTAEELASPGLLAAAVAAGSTTEYRATAESEGIVSVCSKPITYKQETPTPPSEEGGGSVGGGSGSTGDGGISPTGGSGGSTGGGGSSGGTRHGGVVYVAPLVRITFAPGAKTRQRRPTFRFDDSTGQPNTHFFCRVDKTGWRACSSPTKLKRLRFGRHVFSIKAVNAIGVAGQAPVKRAFKVVAR